MTCKNQSIPKSQHDKRTLDTAIQNLAANMYLQLASENQQKITYFSSNQLFSSFPSQLLLNVNAYEEGLDLQFLINISNYPEKRKVPLQKLIQMLNKFNNSQSQFLRVCYQQQICNIVIQSPKISYDNPPHMLEELMKQSKRELQNLIKILTKEFVGASGSKSQKGAQKLNCLRIIIEKNRKKKTKSSDIDLSNLKLSPPDQKLSQEYNEWKKSCLSRREKREQISSDILRLIEIISSKRQDRKIKSGNFSQVTLLNSHYKIVTLGSSHPTVNSQLQKAIQAEEQQMKLASETSDSSNTSEKEVVPQYIQTKSYLVAKSLRKSMQQALLNQITILIAFRQSKSPAINSYFCVDDLHALDRSNLEGVCIYSQYHDRDMNFKITKKKNCLLVMENLIEGLDFLFQKKKILHRDLKPDNILLSQKLQPKIIDFGSSYYSSSYRGSRLNLSNDLKTTRHYNLFYSQMPEQIKDKYNRYEFNTSPLFDMHAFGVLVNQYFKDFCTEEQLGSEIHEWLVWLGETCTRINPQDRPQPIDVYIFLKQIASMIAEQKNGK